MSQFSSSADKIAANGDLLTEILIHLPVKSILQFKSVSKHWLSLITDPNFARRRNLHPSSISGLFFYSSTRRLNPNLNFIPLQNNTNQADDAHLRSLPSIPGLSGLRILNSCHGLLCCSSSIKTEPSKFQYHILNPTTKQFTSLPDPHNGPKGLSLAFDPAISPHYKVVCVHSVSIEPNQIQSDECHLQVEMYSSEIGFWRASGNTFAADRCTQFLAGVYWNGAIHWFSSKGNNSLYFRVDDGSIGTMPMPAVPEGNQSGRDIRYYGESRGHLHLVEMYGAGTRFSVYEMERDYSRWFVKYHVVLDAVAAAFPEMMQGLSWNPISLAVLSVERGEKEEGSFLVLHIPRKILRYNLMDKTHKEICDVDPEQCDGNGMIEDSLRFFWFHAFQYMESLSRI